MKNVNVLEVKTRIDKMLPTLNEYQRRRYLATEAISIGYGGISVVSRISGVSRQTLTEGVKELDNPDTVPMDVGKSRRPGGGRKRVTQAQPGILVALEKLVDAHTKGDPMRLLLWTNKSLRNLEKSIVAQGYKVCYRVIGDMLEELGYGLQANKKTLTVKPAHPDRNTQFEHINSEAADAVASGIPVISIDAKKKENIGNFKNSGKMYRPHGSPKEVLDHDFPLAELGKATPFGVYDIFRNKGFVNVGLSSDTAAFAVESIRRWWKAEGATFYPRATKIVITADCGGSNGRRNRLWKLELQRLADELGKDIQVMHYPPGTSKWNKIEHRLFAFISKNWQGKPLISAAVIVQLIGATTTTKGLTVCCVLDENEYEKGIKVTDEEYGKILIKEEEFHGDWNYTICKSNDDL